MGATRHELRVVGNQGSNASFLPERSINSWGFQLFQWRKASLWMNGNRGKDKLAGKKVEAKDRSCFETLETCEVWWVQQSPGARNVAQTLGAPQFSINWVWHSCPSRQQEEAGEFKLILSYIAVRLRFRPTAFNTPIPYPEPPVWEFLQHRLKSQECNPRVRDGTPSIYSGKSVGVQSPDI